MLRPSAPTYRAQPRLDTSTGRDRLRQHLRVELFRGIRKLNYIGAESNAAARNAFGRVAEDPGQGPLTPISGSGSANP